MHTFQTGHEYSQSFISNADIVATFRIDRRTAKSVWITQVFGNGQEEIIGRKAVSKSFDGTEETFKPFGTYSMCMVVGAAKVAA